jgi:hypothetical protein
MNIYLQGNGIHLKWDIDHAISEGNSAYAKHVTNQLTSYISRSASKEILCPL